MGWVQRATAASNKKKAMKFNEKELIKYAFSPMDVAMEGFLLKQGVTFGRTGGAMKKRYFVLKVS